MNLQQVLQRSDVWRGSDAPCFPTVPSGYASLDRLLPGGGWPRQALVDVILPHEGIGELRLLVPALVRLSREQRWIAFIAPPYIPFAPALAAAGVDLARLLVIRPRARADHEWALETCLRAGACAAVLGWVENATIAHLRRWQLAAEAGGTLGVLFRRRPLAHSPAALRLQLAGAGSGPTPAVPVANRAPGPALPSVYAPPPLVPARGKSCTPATSPLRPPQEGGGAGSLHGSWVGAIDIDILKRRGGWPVGPVRLELDDALAVRATAALSDRDQRPRRAGG